MHFSLLRIWRSTWSFALLRTLETSNDCKDNDEDDATDDERRIQGVKLVINLYSCDSVRVDREAHRVVVVIVPDGVLDTEGLTEDVGVRGE